MAFTPQQKPGKAPKPETGRNPFGWVLFAATVAIILYQLYIHGYELLAGYGKALLDGNMASYLSAAGPLEKAIYVLWAFNDLFLTFFLIVALVFMLLRKKAAPRLLVIFVSFAGVFTLVVGIVLQNLLPVSLSGMTLFYNVESAVFIAVDILLFFLYLKSKQFRAICSR